MKRVFQTDDQNVLIHGVDVPVEDDDSYSLPYGCVSVGPPTGAGAGALRWVSEVGRVDASFGEEGTGVWAVTADLRRASLYLTSTGASYSIGHAVDGKSYDGLGELPSWLTDKPRPSGAYRWADGDWVLDEGALADASAQVERSWRDSAIAATDFMMMPDYPIDAARRAELAAYRTALRDWPENAAFPNPGNRPAAPDWLADELG